MIKKEDKFGNIKAMIKSMSRIESIKPSFGEVKFWAR